MWCFSEFKAIFGIFCMSSEALLWACLVSPNPRLLLDGFDPDGLESEGLLPSAPNTPRSGDAPKSSSAACPGCPDKSPADDQPEGGDELAPGLPTPDNCLNFALEQFASPKGGGGRK